MLDTSILLLIQHVFLYLSLPIFMGIPCMFFIFGKKFSGVELYIVSWFIGIGYATFFLYILQFIYFGVGIYEYFLGFIIIIFAFIIKCFVSKDLLSSYIENLKVSMNIKKLKELFTSLHTAEKIGFIFGSIYVVSFLLLAFLYNTSFPTYFDDTFGNWNLAALNIYFDGGFLIFGNLDEILGYGGRINYPIFINIFKALVANFVGAWYETYQNLFQYMSYLMMCIFIFYISLKKTKNLFYAILPVFLVSGLSLLFFHIIDGYMDLVCGFYSVFTIYYLYQFLENKNIEYFLISMIFGILLINIKNDAFVVYLPAILIAFMGYVYFSGQFRSISKDIFQMKYIYHYVGIIVFFFIPPVFVRFYHGFALNPQSGDGHESEKIFHPEIFSYFDDIFLKADNYNLVLLIILVVFLYQKKGNTRFILLAFLAVFAIFCLVFLCTSNYRWVLDQTTVNRVFLSSFFILLSFVSFFVGKEEK